MPSLFAESPSFRFIETIACAFLTAVVWLCSLTICFPLFLALVCCAGLRDKSFAFILSSVITKCNRYRNFSHYRRKLFDLVNENESKGRSGPVRILEVGVGNGENFGYYPENHSLTTVDKNPEFESYLHSTLQKYPKIKLEKVITACAEDMSMIQDNEYDVVVATRLLCSVTDVDTVLNELHRVLKQGGKFAMIDHVIHPRRYFLENMIQNVMTPMWRIYFNGCNLNRDILENLKKSRFSEVSFKMYYPYFMDLFFRPHLMAICTK